MRTDETTGQPGDAPSPFEIAPAGPARARAGAGPKLEVGILAAGGAPREIVDRAVCRLEDALQACFPAFDWCLSRQRWAPRRTTSGVEPSALLTEAAERRDAAHWDFVLVVTDGDLVGHFRPYAFAMLSRPLDAAIVSLARLNALGDGGEREASRVATLMGQALAHIGGLDAHEAPGNLMYRPTRAADLDAMGRLEPDQRERWRAHLEEIADQRLEESHAPRHPLRFVLGATWINRVEIAQAILGARPWQLPYRLGRLSAAAVSALAIVMMTAEAWDVGLSLGAGRLAVLAVVALAGTTVFVALRQKLLLRRAVARTEQTVVTAVASVSILLIGMLAAWLLLALLALAASGLIFPARVIAGWAPGTLGDPSAVSWLLRLRMAAFVASLAAMIGALGASFEDQHYFRHVVLVDEEV